MPQLLLLLLLKGPEIHSLATNDNDFCHQLIIVSCFMLDCDLLALAFCMEDET